VTVVYAAGGLTIDWVKRDGFERGPSLGGNAAYAAAGAFLAGANAEVVAVLGTDYPDELLDQLAGVGIGVEHSRRSESPSFRVLLDDSGPERRISYLPGSGSNAGLDPLPYQLPQDLLGAALHICAIPTSSQQALIDAADAERAVVTLDTVYIPGQIEPTADELVDLARRVDTFLPSREEAARFWAGSPEDALETLASVGVTRAVIKLGPLGAIGLEEGRLVRQLAAPADVVDTTGAGDAFCGAYCAARGAGQDLATAMAWGAAAASVVIEGYGLTHALSADAVRLARGRYETLTRSKEVGALR